MCVLLADSDDEAWTLAQARVRLLEGVVATAAAAAAAAAAATGIAALL
jgi:hypothetical protein